MKKKNLNKKTAEDPFEPEAHHALLIAGEINSAEAALGSKPFWFDVHRYSAVAMSNLGSDFDDTPAPNSPIRIASATEP